MPRVKFRKDRQKEFLNTIFKVSCLSWSKIARLSGVCERTIRDWRREKLKMSYEALLKLCKLINIPIPKDIRVLPDYWSTKKAAKIGAKRRNELYGNPGTPEGRRRGGLNSQRKFRLDPVYARKLGVKIRKEIQKPRPSSFLAEFIGIMLGDGGISDHQVSITFNRQTDREYSLFLRKIVKDLFSISSSIISTEGDKGDKVVISSKNLVEFLEKKGLKRGNKIRNKVDIPNWIWGKKDYQIACLRGLVDTDGSFYTYKHKVNGKIYENCALCLTNYSVPLLASAKRVFEELGFSPTMGRRRLYLYKWKEIERYFKEIGTDNPKQLGRYYNYISSCN